MAWAPGLRGDAVSEKRYRLGSKPDVCSLESASSGLRSVTFSLHPQLVRGLDVAEAPKNETADGRLSVNQMMRGLSSTPVSVPPSAGWPWRGPCRGAISPNFMGIVLEQTSVRECGPISLLEEQGRDTKSIQY